MVELTVKSRDGADVDAVDVDPSRFGDRVKLRLMQEVCVMTEQNQRVGTVMTRDRSMVAGSNKKPWRQKGTGRARHGTRKSPIWRSGGITHGPQPKSYKVDIPKKMRRSALRSALLGKLQDDEIVCVEDLDFPRPKTREAAQMLEALGIGDASCLIVTPEYDELVHRVVRNIPTVTLRPAKDLNCYEVLKHGVLLVTREALDHLPSEPVGKE